MYNVINWNKAIKSFSSSPKVAEPTSVVSRARLSFTFRISFPGGGLSALPAYEKIIRDVCFKADRKKEQNIFICLQRERGWRLRHSIRRYLRINLGMPRFLDLISPPKRLLMMMETAKVCEYWILV